MFCLPGRQQLIFKDWRTKVLEIIPLIISPCPLSLRSHLPHCLCRGQASNGHSLCECRCKCRRTHQHGGQALVSLALVWVAHGGTRFTSMGAKYAKTSKKNTSNPVAPISTNIQNGVLMLKTTCSNSCSLIVLCKTTTS